MTKLASIIGFAILSIAVLLVMVVGCADPIEPDVPETTYSWKVVEHSLDPNLDFSGVMGISENRIFVVGGIDDDDISDVIVKYENDDWTYDFGPKTTYYNRDHISDIHMLPSGYGYAVGLDGSYVYTNDEWFSRSSSLYTAVWVDRFEEVWTVSVDGKIWYLEYGLWDSWEEFPEEFTDIYKIDDQMFIVGMNGVVVHKVGWSESVELDSGTLASLFGVWGSAATDMFAVGTDGTIIHFDGELWRPMQSGVEAYLYGVWGTSANDVFAVGENGTILHYDGAHWTQMANPARFTLKDIWGTSGTNVYAVGDNCTILRYSEDPRE